MLLSAHGQVVVASVLAGVSASHSGVSASRRLVGGGSEAARPCGLKVFACLVLCSLFFPTLFAESQCCDALQRLQGSNWGGYRPCTPDARPHRRGVGHLVSTCPSPKARSARDAPPPTPNTTSNTRRNDRLTPHTRASRWGSRRSQPSSSSPTAARRWCSRRCWARSPC